MDRPAATRLIERVGARGDGVTAGPEGARFVPFALPGEEIVTRDDGGRTSVDEVRRPSPDRVTPICRYFGDCGGCKLQHWRLEPYLVWKRGLVVAALAAQGIDAPVSAIIDAHGAGRRRATFHACRDRDGVRCGFMRAGSHDIVDIASCPVLAPGLAAAPAAALACAELFTRGGKPLDIAVTATDAGLDVATRGHGPASKAERQDAIGLAERLDLARLSLHHEVVVERRPTRLIIGGQQVALPPGAFLQATVAGERALTELAVAALGKARRVADLFCGLGPFALAVARTARVDAYDADNASVAALAVAGHAPGLKPVTATRRDLFRRPLLAAELATCDAAILDPPRQGAEAQTRELARSALKRIVYVSCNPATFARDAAALIAAGYRLGQVTPVDQFRYSPHVELVGVFQR